MLNNDPASFVQIHIPIQYQFFLMPEGAWMNFFMCCIFENILFSLFLNYFCYICHSKLTFFFQHFKDGCSCLLTFLIFSESHFVLVFFMFLLFQFQCDSDICGFTVFFNLFGKFLTTLSSKRSLSFPLQIPLSEILILDGIRPFDMVAPLLVNAICQFCCSCVTLYVRVEPQPLIGQQCIDLNVASNQGWKMMSAQQM